MTVQNKQLKSKVSQLLEKFLSSGISNPLTALEQISYLLFMKRYDELETPHTTVKGQPAFEVTFGASPKGDPIDKAQLRWSHFRELKPRGRLEHVTHKVFPFMRKLKNDPYRAFAKYMADAVFLITRPSLLEDGMRIIDEIYEIISHQDQQPRDTLGDVYESLLNETITTGKNGQFRTPGHIIRMIVEIIDPGHNDIICDPACGTGGFLVAAYKHMLYKHVPEKSMRENEDGFKVSIDKIKAPKADQLNSKPFLGFDVDQTMVRLALMNLMLHDIGVPHIEMIDTLSKRFDEYETTTPCTIVLSNPPFQGVIDEGKRSKELVDSDKTDLLFLDRIMRLVREGGRAGVIVPSGVLLTNSLAHQNVREKLLRTCQLEAVISMPGGIFKPYSGAGSAILIFAKTKEGTKKAKVDGMYWSTQHVWFYNMTSDGYSLDDERKRDLNNPAPLPLIVKVYRELITKKEADTDRKSDHFFVPIGDIMANNLSLSFHSYYVQHEDTHHEQPTKILESLLSLEKEIMQDMEALKDVLK